MEVGTLVILVQVLAAETSPDPPTQAEAEEQEPALGQARAPSCSVSISCSLGELKPLVFCVTLQRLKYTFWVLTVIPTGEWQVESS